MKKFFVVILLVFLLAAGAILYLQKRETTTISTKYNGFHFICEGEDIPKEDFARIDKQFYLSFDFIKKYLDPEIAYDKNERTIIIANQKGTKYIPLDSKTANFNGGEIELRDPAIEKDGKIMLPIESFIYDYNVNLRYIEDIQILLMDFTDVEYAKGSVKDSAIIREEASKNSPIVKRFKSNDTVYVYSEKGDYYRVREIDGFAGYVKKSQVEVKLPKNRFKIEKNEKREAAKPLNLTWDYTYAKQSKDSIDKITNVLGLNVICPTWFSFKSDGSIIDRADIEYVNKYNSHGIDVWGYLDNSFDADITHQALSSANTRKKIISKTYELLKNYNLKGINIDIEQTRPEDRDNITQFQKELYYFYKSKGILVSVDITPQITKDVNKQLYDRKKLSDFSDYVIVMAYDQHWSSSQKAGSVAQYKWVEGSINVLFKSVDPHKMVLGIPLYTRLWVENSGNLTSSTLSMDQVASIISSKNLTPKFDEESKQNYVEYFEASKTYKIWIEDEKSISHKASLVNKYKLNGIAAWRKGFEKQSIWPVIDEQLKTAHNI